MLSAASAAGHVVCPTASRASSGSGASATHGSRAAAAGSGQHGRSAARSSSNATFSGRDAASSEHAPHPGGFQQQQGGRRALRAFSSRGRAAAGIVRATFRSSSPSRINKLEIKLENERRGNTVASSAVAPPDAEVESALEVFDELSAKVAQMQALLAEELTNSSLMDPENLARLEEGYLRGSFEEGEDLDGGVALRRRSGEG
eukprot:CAMPEP_0197590906 /NCGR_PEP_ID=MMETSP1326-20131121/12288_1 /TAXON_ID=1155430 /ORGANISM="Genus nov. species nov., Strain RCC2288" /LENGTH=202 /DNA_ID=CAMNT_0043156209 /DNA_START=244 /DNA_END=849 /DNA_ORIENTATION=-